MPTSFPSTRFQRTAYVHTVNSTPYWKRLRHDMCEQKVAGLHREHAHYRGRHLCEMFHIPWPHLASKCYQRVTPTQLVTLVDLCLFWSPHHARITVVANDLDKQEVATSAQTCSGREICHVPGKPHRHHPRPRQQHFCPSHPP